MADLWYVPKKEFDRIRTINISPERSTAIFATLCRINTLYMIMRAGSGHIGTSFSSLDILSWLFLREMDIEKDIFFSSKGHDAPAKYSVLIALGLLDFDLLHKLRRMGGLPGHPDISIPYMHTNTGSLGMGISKARGMALARRLKGETGHIYVMTGDGELQEGQFWESLQPTANRALGEITVIIDHNKLQSDTFVSHVSDLGNLERKLAGFGWHVARCDGHDMTALHAVFDEFRSVTDKPKILIADTVKGKGVPFMEHTVMGPNDRLYGFHSGAPDIDKYTSGAKALISSANAQLEAAGAPARSLCSVPLPGRTAPDGMQRLIPAYSRALVEQGAMHPNLVALDADLALDTGLLAFEERFPDRFFECGIAEQDMVSQAGGMALHGLLPVVHSFACFLSDRPNEQIYNNATERTKIIYVGSLAGLVPGGPGHSHQCVRDISALGGVPGLVLIEPSCEQEVGLVVDYCVNSAQENSYIRLVSIPCKIPYMLPADYKLEQGRGIALTDGDDAIVFSYGPVMLSQAFEASRRLAGQGIGLKVVNLPWLNRVDSEWLAEIIAGYPYIFTLDNHYVSGGQGEFILARIAEMGSDQAPRLKQLGVRDIPVCGANDEVLRAHRLDAESLMKHIGSVLRLV